MQVKLFRKDEAQRHFPAAEGEASDIVQLLAFWGTVDLYVVYDGEKYVDARVFAVELGGSVRPAESSETPDEKMRREDLMDPIIHARNHTIEQIIRRSIESSHWPHYDPELLARNAAHDVIRLFY